MKRILQSSAQFPIIAVFDFDHTLTIRDSLLPLLIYSEGAIKAYAKLACLLPYFIGFLFKFVSRQQVKEKILAQFFEGKSLQEVEEMGKVYADQYLDQFLRPKALERLRWHQQQGHRCILVSASLELYLIPWAKRYGFEDVIASQLEITDQGYVTGKLRGKNCWGPEKERRLLERLGPRQDYQLYVYGDSRGDREILEAADYAFFQTFG